MQLNSELFNAWKDATAHVAYRPSLIVGLWHWESGLNPGIVGDREHFDATLGDVFGADGPEGPGANAIRVAALLHIFDTEGLASAQRTQVSLGLGQVNAVNWTDTYTPRALLTPAPNAAWSARFLDQLFAAYGNDEKMAVSAYRGPGVTKANGSWEWDAARTNAIVAYADAIDAEGITDGGGASSPPATIATSPGSPPAGGVAVGVQFDFVSLANDLEAAHAALVTARTAIAPMLP